MIMIQNKDSFKSMKLMKLMSGDIDKFLYEIEHLSKSNVIHTELGRVSIKESNYESLRDFRVLWEKGNRVERRRLNDDGNTIIEEIEEFELAEIRIWIFSRVSDFIFILFKDSTSAKVDKIIKCLFRDFFIKRLILSNVFFDTLIMSSNNIILKGKTITIGDDDRRLSVDNFSLKKKQFENILEVKLEVLLDKKFLIKINNEGLIKFFNRPSYDHIYKIAEQLNFVFTNYDLAREVELYE